MGFPKVLLINNLLVHEAGIVDCCADVRFDTSRFTFVTVIYIISPLSVTAGTISRPPDVTRWRHLAYCAAHCCMPGKMSSSRVQEGSLSSLHRARGNELILRGLAACMHVQGVVVQLKAASSEKRQADWHTKRVFFCTPEVSAAAAADDAAAVAGAAISAALLQVGRQHEAAVVACRQWV